MSAALHSLDPLPFAPGTLSALRTPAEMVQELTAADTSSAHWIGRSLSLHKPARDARHVVLTIRNDEYNLGDRCEQDCREGDVLTVRLGGPLTPGDLVLVGWGSMIFLALCIQSSHGVVFRTVRRRERLKDDPEHFRVYGPVVSRERTLLGVPLTLPVHEAWKPCTARMMPKGLGTGKTIPAPSGSFCASAPTSAAAGPSYPAGGYVVFDEDLEAESGDVVLARVDFMPAPPMPRKGTVARNALLLAEERMYATNAVPSMVCIRRLIVLEDGRRTLVALNDRLPTIPEGKQGAVSIQFEILGVATNYKPTFYALDGSSVDCYAL